MKVQPAQFLWVLYPIGDVIAQLITGQMNLQRLVALSLMGMLFYQQEVPAWFRVLDGVSMPKRRWGLAGNLILKPTGDGFCLNWLGRTLGAILYFNPVWIARHVFVIALATTPWPGLEGLAPMLSESMTIGGRSFLVNLPVSFAGNYIIQEKLPLERRFVGSAIFTGIMAILYALATVYLR